MSYPINRFCHFFCLDTVRLFFFIWFLILLSDHWRARWEASGETVRLATCLPPRLLADLGLDARYPDSKPGTAVFLRKDKRTRLLCVRCRDGWLAVDGIYYGQKKVMLPLDFYNGFLTKGTGQIFVRDTDTPAEPAKGGWTDPNLY